jgi:hypothetical protein
MKINHLSFLLVISTIAAVPIFSQDVNNDDASPFEVLSRENYEKHIENQQMFSYRSLTSGAESFHRYNLNDDGLVVVSDLPVEKRNGYTNTIEDYPYQSLYNYLSSAKNTRRASSEIAGEQITTGQIIPESPTEISMESIFALLALVVLICAVELFCVCRVRRNNLRNLVYLISMKTTDDNPGQKKRA